MEFLKALGGGGAKIWKPSMLGYGYFLELPNTLHLNQLHHGYVTLLLLSSEAWHLNDPKSYAGWGFSPWYGSTFLVLLRGRDLKKDGPWSSRLGIGHGANHPTP